jgi:hypothetical protein
MLVEAHPPDSHPAELTASTGASARARLEAMVGHELAQRLVSALSASHAGRIRTV